MSQNSSDEETLCLSIPHSDKQEHIVFPMSHGTFILAPSVTSCFLFGYANEELIRRTLIIRPSSWCSASYCPAGPYDVFSRLQVRLYGICDFVGRQEVSWRRQNRPHDHIHQRDVVQRTQNFSCLFHHQYPADTHRFTTTSELHFKMNRNVCPQLPTVPFLVLLSAEFFEDTSPLHQSLKYKYIFRHGSVEAACIVGYHFTFSEYAASVSQMANPATPCSNQNRSVCCGRNQKSSVTESSGSVARAEKQVYMRTVAERFERRFPATSCSQKSNTTLRPAGPTEHSLIIRSRSRKSLLRPSLTCSVALC